MSLLSDTYSQHQKENWADLSTSQLNYSSILQSLSSELTGFLISSNTVFTSLFVLTGNNLKDTEQRISIMAVSNSSSFTYWLGHA